MISRNIVIGVIAACCAMAPVSAQACAIFQPIEIRLARVLDGKQPPAISIVEVVSAEHTSNRVSDAHPWTASTRHLRTVRGEPDLSGPELWGGNGSAACELNSAIPKPGERWVVYARASERGPARPALVLPYEVAIVRDKSTDFSE